MRLRHPRADCYAAFRVITDLKLVLRVYLQPGAAMSDILDSGSLLFSSIAVLIVSFALAHWSSGFPFPFYGPLFVLAVIYTPGLLLIGGWVGRTSGSFRSAFQRDYAPLLTCVAVAWSAANLPVVFIGWIRPELFVAASGLGYLYFAVLIFFAVRTVFGTGNGAAVAIVSLSWLPLVAARMCSAAPCNIFSAGWLLRSCCSMSSSICGAKWGRTGGIWGRGCAGARAFAVI